MSRRTVWRLKEEEDGEGIRMALSNAEPVVLSEGIVNGDPFASIIESCRISDSQTKIHDSWSPIATSCLGVFSQPDSPNPTPRRPPGTGIVMCSPPDTSPDVIPPQNLVIPETLAAKSVPADDPIDALFAGIICFTRSYLGREERSEKSDASISGRGLHDSPLNMNKSSRNRTSDSKSAKGTEFYEEWNGERKLPTSIKKKTVLDTMDVFLDDAHGRREGDEDDIVKVSMKRGLTFPPPIGTN